MWDKSGFMFSGSVDGPWYADHTGWSWIMGLHGGVWLLIIASIIAILVIAFRLATRNVPLERGRDRSHRVASAQVRTRHPR